MYQPYQGSYYSPRAATSQFYEPRYEEPYRGPAVPPGKILDPSHIGIIRGETRTERIPVQQHYAEMIPEAHVEYRPVER